MTAKARGVRMVRALTAAVTAATISVAVFPADPVHAAQASVIDGDTMVVGGETVRIKGINTPEKGQRCAESATQSLQELLDANGGQATIVNRSGTDKFGRTLADVRIGTTDVGSYMLRKGYAERWGEPGTFKGACGQHEPPRMIPLSAAVVLGLLTLHPELIDHPTLAPYVPGYLKPTAPTPTVHRSSSTRSSSSGYTGCRAYAPGGKTYKPIPYP